MASIVIFVSLWTLACLRVRPYDFICLDFQLLIYVYCSCKRLPYWEPSLNRINMGLSYLSPVISHNLSIWYVGPVHCFLNKHLQKVLHTSIASTNINLPAMLLRTTRVVLFLALPLGAVSSVNCPDVPLQRRHAYSAMDLRSMAEDHLEQHQQICLAA